MLTIELLYELRTDDRQATAKIGGFFLLREISRNRRRTMKSSSDVTVSGIDKNVCTALINH